MPIIWCDAPAQRRQDLAACSALLRQGSRSFHLAGLLLPRRISDEATALYAFCRRADDAIDLAPGASGAALAGLRAQLERVYAGEPAADPMERLLAAVVARHAMPRVWLEALLEGFAWDGENRQYATLSALQSYAARVAGSVGAMMTLLMGVRERAVIARACELGIAMQLTNIARDVGQDAHSGRLYLPHEWLREARIDPADWLSRPRFTPALGGVIERLLAVADELYGRAAAAIGRLPADCRAGIHAARLLYREIGQDLRRHGLDSLERRAHVAAGRKTLLLAAALGAALRPAAQLGRSTLAESEFLVEAIDSGPLAAERGVAGGARKPEQGRIEWVLELCERLQQRDRLVSASGSAAASETATATAPLGV
jgi:phytoene synthase